MTESIEQIIARNGYIIHSVKGNSMMPMLDEQKDLVKIVPATSSLKVGDLPLFKRPNGDYVLHRVIGIRKKYYLICGDNRKAAEKVPPEWILGITDGFYKNGNYIPCTDESYLKYVKKTCKRLRTATFFNKFSILRIMRKWKHRRENANA